VSSLITHSKKQKKKNKRLFLNKTYQKKKKKKKKEKKRNLGIEMLLFKAMCITHQSPRPR